MCDTVLVEFYDTVLCAVCSVCDTVLVEFDDTVLCVV